MFCFEVSIEKVCGFFFAISFQFCPLNLISLNNKSQSILLNSISEMFLFENILNLIKAAKEIERKNVI